ncbi:GFA family protein [Bacterioplanoides sp. SCSIO 12839]|uniref:GFA family protein n=1 Tax=Bacterioplanoides sp. SCSIO 12839 TaxID=2829569 RepID=UPI002104E718|nr:hypothetical protein [Bacterioplanoides sp. SCSIO 12839]UTW47270.1 GFA family protein [Bacterioplanoides sp. SCSIO 12839]
MKTVDIKAQCRCGKVSFSIQGPALLRGYCHCSICQAVNHAPHADITVFRARDVEAPDASLLQYNAYKFPPILQRGKCADCGDIAIEYLTLGVLPKTVIVPTKNLSGDCVLPEPAFHMFYENRVADADDTLPKGKGYLASQWLFAKKLISVLFGK